MNERYTIDRAHFQESNSYKRILQVISLFATLLFNIITTCIIISGCNNLIFQIMKGQQRSRELAEASEAAKLPQTLMNPFPLHTIRS